MKEIEKLKIKREEALKRQEIRKLENKMKDVQEEKMKYIHNQMYEQAALMRDEEKTIRDTIKKLNEESK